jgi:hypothetical protein
MFLPSIRPPNKTRKLPSEYKEDPRIKRFKPAESVDASSIVDKSNLSPLFTKTAHISTNNSYAKMPIFHNAYAKTMARIAKDARKNPMSMQDFEEGEEEYTNVINPSAAMAPKPPPAMSFTENIELPDISLLSIETPKLPPIGKKVTEKGGKRKTRKSKKGTRKNKRGAIKNKSRKHRRSSKK